MANLVDYVERLGGVPFSRSPLTQVDALVLATLVYMPLGVAAGEGFRAGVPLGEAARALLDADGHTGFPAAANKDRRLLAALADSARFGALRVMGFEARDDAAAQEQFAAAAFLSDDGAVLVFRGTDGSVAGWKEDFNMSFELEVPAQRSAVDYVRRAHAALGLPMRLCGHSKGGNLAAYAALFAPEPARSAVLTAYSFDGPGFNETVAARRARVEAARVRTFVPQGSIVGMLLWHSEPFTVVRSDGLGILQHDPYTWQVMGGAFVPAERTFMSRYADATVKEWLFNLPAATRRKAIDGIYEVVAGGGEERVADLLDARSLLAALAAARSLDGETRAAIEDMLRLLGDAALEAAPDALAEAAERFGEDVARRVADGRWRAKERASQNGK